MHFFIGFEEKKKYVEMRRWVSKATYMGKSSKEKLTKIEENGLRLQDMTHPPAPPPPPFKAFPLIWVPF